MLDKHNYLRQNSEIIIDSPRVRAEGTFPRKYGNIISYEDIEKFLKWRGFKIVEIQMTLDAITQIWHWNCKMEKIK